MIASQYTPAEGKARDEIDQKLVAAGWTVQTRQKMNLYEGAGQAVREFTLKDGHGRVDYLLSAGPT
jgi:type I restriction enzyme, R subunit